VILEIILLALRVIVEFASAFVVLLVMWMLFGGIVERPRRHRRGGR
jgi:hypothetical protein